jgi:hypothetical protein
VTKERLNSLIEQTSFLLERQKELHAKTSTVFNTLLSVVENKLKTIDTTARKQDADDLMAITGYVSDHKAKSDEQIKDDIDFLAEQLTALNQIKAVNDDAKMEELLNMIIAKDEKIPDTAAFKKMIADETVNNFRDLDLMLSDMKSAIEEDDIHEIKLLLEAIKDQENSAKDEHGCGSECSSCSSCKGGADVFDPFPAGNNPKVVHEDKSEEDCDCKDCGCGCSDCDK